MNDDKIDPKLRTILSKLPANTVKIEDPRYEISIRISMVTAMV